jgi:hypothetical protein
LTGREFRLNRSGGRRADPVDAAECGRVGVFSSLDRVDIVLKPGPDGRKQFVQTDHRTAQEIEQEPELSVLFALIRILNPRRMADAGSPEPVVI